MTIFDAGELASGMGLKLGKGRSRLLIFRTEGVTTGVVRHDLPLALDASLEFLTDFVGGSFRDCAASEQGAQTHSAKNAGNFHRGSIEKAQVMAIPIPTDLLLEAYRQGAFPMAMTPGDIRWFSPQLRGILPLEGFHIPHGTRRAVADPRWEVRIDTVFREVMQACAERKDTWIDDVILESYGQLHEMGHAHSVEIWRDGALAGGLYGVSIGGVFFGESMFHRVTNASKVALVWLVRILRAGGFRLLDTQWTTPHLAQFGAIEVPRPLYLRRLRVALDTPATFQWPLPANGVSD
jgi:leucyl/phenylalanyl-tRNA--protein transferase